MYSCDVICRFLPFHVYKHIPICIFVCICLAANRSVPKSTLCENTVAALKSHSVQWISLVTIIIKFSKGLFNKSLSSGALNSTI